VNASSGAGGWGDDGSGLPDGGGGGNIPGITVGDGGDGGDAGPDTAPLVAAVGEPAEEASPDASGQPAGFADAFGPDGTVGPGSAPAP
jgi:hypothetical protein